MIEATIRIGDGEDKTVDNPVTLPAVPPIGGHVAFIDLNANHRVFRVDDVVVGAVGERMLAELPNASRSQMRVTILCTEAYGHPMRVI